MMLDTAHVTAAITKMIAAPAPPSTR